MITVNFDNVLVSLTQRFLEYADPNLDYDKLTSSSIAKALERDQDDVQYMFEGFKSSFSWEEMFNVGPSVECIDMLRGLKTRGYKLTAVTSIRRGYGVHVKDYLKKYTPGVFDLVLCGADMKYFEKLSKDNILIDTEWMNGVVSKNAKVILLNTAPWSRYRPEAIPYKEVFTILDEGRELVRHKSCTELTV